MEGEISLFSFSNCFLIFLLFLNILSFDLNISFHSRLPHWMNSNYRTVESITLWSVVLNQKVLICRTNWFYSIRSNDDCVFLQKKSGEFHSFQCLENNNILLVKKENIKSFMVLILLMDLFILFYFSHNFCFCLLTIMVISSNCPGEWWTTN